MPNFDHFFVREIFRIAPTDDLAQECNVDLLV